MANYDFTNIGYNSNNYYARDSKVFLIKGTQTSSTNVWTGALPGGVDAYADGLTVDYFLPYAGNSTAATLNLGGKGAKPVYINGTTAVKTQFPQYSVIRLTYVVNSAINSGNGAWLAGSTPTDTDSKVTQTATTSSAAYELLFSATADNTTRTEGARKTSTLTYNPSTKALSTGGTVNGYTLAAASAKGVDTSISAASTSTNLPTSAAVASFVEGKGYGTGTVTGSGTSGYIAKWNGGSSITNGPAFGSDTTKFLRNDGTWQVVATEIPIASDSALGGVKTGYTASVTNRPLLVDSTGKAYVTSNNYVSQTETESGTSSYELILAYTADNSSNKTEGVRKTSGLLYIPTGKKFYMGLDANGSSSTDATSGADKTLFNAIRRLGWYSDVIV